MKSEEVRRLVLAHGGNLSTAGKYAAMSRQGVQDHLKRASARHPLSARFTLHVPAGTNPEDARALIAYLYACLDRVGISRTPDD